MIVNFKNRADLGEFKVIKKGKFFYTLKKIGSYGYPFDQTIEEFNNDFEISK